MIQKISEFDAIKSAVDPRSIAIIGASESEKKFSGTFVPNLIKGGFKGEIYPINPKRTEIMGLKCYPSIKNVPGSVDLAIVAVPSPFVPQVVKECVDKGVKSIILISAGFGEVGVKGLKIQNEMVKICKEGGTRIVTGPNCEGIISLIHNTWAHLFSSPIPPAPGEIAVVAQSGGILEAVLNHMWDYDVGTSYCISTGNEADLGIPDYMDYLVKDVHTKVIVLFIEGIRNGEKFKEAAKMAITTGKPIVAMKVGKSERGRLTAISHTGALTGLDEVYDAIFRRFGIIRAYNIDELIDVAMALAWQPLPKGKRVGAVTDSGGVSCQIADVIEETELELPEFTDNSTKTLLELLPLAATPKNPLDVTGAISPGEYAEKIAKCIEIVAKDVNVDIVLNVVTYWPLPIIPNVAESVVKAAKRVMELGKPFLACWPWITMSAFPEIIKQFTKNKIPFYSMPERALKAAEAMAKYSDFRGRC
jgi:acyl-CoA synthetase (NDP forming)